MSEEERKEGFLKGTIEPERSVASDEKPKKAKLTGKTIEGLRKSRPRIAKKIEKYNEEYEKLISIAREISDEQANETPDVKEIKNNVAKFNAQAERLGKLSVQIIAFNEDNNKISLNGVGVKAIRVPGRLTRILRSFTKAGRKKNEEYEEVMTSIKKSVTDIAKTAIDTSDEKVTVDTDKLTSLGLASDGSPLTEVSDLTQGSLLDSVVKELKENHGYNVSVQEFLEDRPIEFARREEGKTLLDVVRERQAAKAKEEEAAKAKAESGYSSKTSKDVLAIIKGSETLFDAAKALHEEGYSFALKSRSELNKYFILDKDKKVVKVVDPEDSKVGGVVRLSALWALRADNTEVEGAYSEEARPYFDEMIARVGTRNLKGLSDDNIEFRNRVMDLVMSGSKLTQLILGSANKNFCSIKGIEPVVAERKPTEEHVETAPEEDVVRRVRITPEVEETLEANREELSRTSKEVRALNKELEGLPKDSDEYRAKTAEIDDKVEKLVALSQRIIPNPSTVKRYEYVVPDFTSGDVPLRADAHVEQQAETETEEEQVKKAAAETARKATVLTQKDNADPSEGLEKVQISSATEEAAKVQPEGVLRPNLDLDLDTGKEEESPFDEELSDEARDDVEFWKSITHVDGEGELADAKLITPSDVKFWKSVTHVDGEGELALNDDAKLLTPNEAKREHQDKIAAKEEAFEKAREKRARTMLMHCWPKDLKFEMNEEDVDTMISTYGCQSACGLLERLKENAPKAYEEMQERYEEYRRSQIRASLDRYAEKQAGGKTM